MTKQNEWRRFFDGHAPNYMENVFTKNTMTEVDFIIKELALRGKEKILDVGCGTGRHAVELARRGFSVTGLDLSEGMLAEAKKFSEMAGVEIEFIQADATTFDLPGRYDVVICLCEGAFGLLGSGDDPAGHDLAILRNIHRALKPGGKLLLTALNGFRLIRQYSDADVTSGRLDPVFIIERSEVEYNTPEGKKSTQVAERAFAPAELLLMFKVTGFEVDHVGGGTAGNWGKRPIQLDEYELMVMAHKANPAD